MRKKFQNWILFHSRDSYRSLRPTGRSLFDRFNNCNDKGSVQLSNSRILFSWFSVGWPKNSQNAFIYRRLQAIKKNLKKSTNITVGRNWHPFSWIIPYRHKQSRPNGLLCLYCGLSCRLSVLLPPLSSRLSAAHGEISRLRSR